MRSENTQIGWGSLAMLVSVQKICAPIGTGFRGKSIATAPEPRGTGSMHHVFVSFSSSCA